VKAYKKVTVALYTIGHSKVFVFLNKTQRNMLSAKVDNKIRKKNNVVLNSIYKDAGSMHNINIMELIITALTKSKAFVRLVRI
jgi:hypothetical protein